MDPKAPLFDRLLWALRPTDKVNPGEIIGVSGTAAYGGWLVTQERNPKLVGHKKYKTYAEIMANVSIVAAGIRYFLNMVSKGNWKVEPAENGGKQADDAAEIVEDALKGLETPWYRVVRRMAMFKFHGFSVAEWTALQASDGRVLMHDVEARPQMTIERWDISETGVVAGFIQRAPRDQRVIYLPREKCLYAVDDALDDSPEGMGLFRQLADAARRLERYQELEGFGFEADLRGMPILKAPMQMLHDLVVAGKITAAQKEQLLTPMKDFLRNHIKNPQLGVMLDSSPYRSLDAAASPSGTNQWSLDIAKNDSEAQSDVAGAIVRLNEEMARVIGVEHLLLGGGPRGSNSLSRDKSDNFALTVDSTLAELRQTFEKDLVRPLMDLNGIPQEMAPKFKTDATAYRDVEQITTALLQMAQAGAVLQPDDEAIQEVRDILGLSRLTDDQIEVAVQDAAGQVPPTPGASIPGKKPAPAKPGQKASAIGQQDAKPAPGESAKMKGDQAARQKSAESDGASASSGKGSP